VNSRRPGLHRSGHLSGAHRTTTARRCTGRTPPDIAGARSQTRFWWPSVLLASRSP